MQTQLIPISVKMAEAAPKLRYTAEELLKYSSYKGPCADFGFLPRINLRFDFQRNVLCPTTRWFIACKWRGDFKDLKEHLMGNHEILRVKSNAIILTKTMFFAINRGFVMNDDAGEIYFVNVTYYVDKILYVNVISLKDRMEIRGYRVSIMGQYHFGEVGEGNYVKIAGIRDYFTENQALEFSIDFL